MAHAWHEYLTKISDLINVGSGIESVGLGKSEKSNKPRPYVYFRLVWGKSPRFYPPSPPRILGIFGDFPPKYPRTLTCPHPQSTPELCQGSIFVPTPKFGVFRGFSPPKTPLYDFTPSPKYPQNSGFFGD